MDRIDKVFVRFDQWTERNSRILEVVSVFLLLAIFPVTYYFTGSVADALLAVAFFPLVFIMGTAIVGMIFVPAIISMDLLAEQLARRGLPYWLAVVCMTPIGLLVVVLMIFFIDWSLAVGLP